MEEKNENDEKNVEEVKPKKGFFSKMFGFLRFCLILVILSFVASIVGVYYFKGARDFVKQNYPEIKIPSKFAYSDAPEVIEITKIVENPESLNEESKEEPKEEPKETLVVTESVNESVTEIPIKAETKVEAPIEAMVEVGKETLSQEVESIEEETKEINKEIDSLDNDLNNEDAGNDDEVEKDLQPKDSLDGVVLPSGNVEVIDIKDKEFKKQALKQAVENVEAMNHETNRFNEASFDPVKKSEERVPADKYSSLSVDEKFIDLMNRNSDLVGIAKQMSERISRIENTRVDPMLVSAVIGKVDKIENQISASPLKAINSALVISLSHLRYAILSGESFVYELDNIKLLATGNEKVTSELKKLDLYVGGVKTSSALKQEFLEALTSADNFVMTKDEDGIKSKILDKINDVVVIKRVDGKPLNKELLALSNKVIPLIEKGDMIVVAQSFENLDDNMKKIFESFIKNVKEKSEVMSVVNHVNELIKESFLSSMENKKEAEK